MIASRTPPGVAQHLIIPEPQNAKPLIFEPIVYVGCQLRYVGLGVLVLPLPRGMLDGEDDDFLVRLIDRVINEIWILSGDQLTHAFNGLRSAALRKQN
jgi:hypothetical protein